MDLKRLTEWLGTMDGLSKSILALFGLPAIIYAGTTKFFDSYIKRFGLYPEVSIVAPALIALLIGLLLWLSFRRFYRSSRLEQPDAFTLRPTGPGSLLGRAEDLAGLLNAVKNHRLVLLDGESGCGKSALVSAGLIPSLLPQNGLLPVAIYDWGDDWLRGALSAAQDALFQSVSQIDREKLGWTSSPDLAAHTESLALDLNARLIAVVHTLGRRPLLIADQFDDYQAQYRNRFMDDDGNWLSPSALAKSNCFWDLVNDGLSEGRLHLLVITRADTAAGLACVRFLDGDQTSTRTLPRVEAEHLRPLLAGIAADDTLPPVVSNPAGGWHELRDRLEIDLKAERAILMQQVRTVLLGLRQLPVLTPRSYRNAGGLQGLGTLVISRSIIRASDSAGGGEAGIRTVRALLGHLIMAGGPNQPPKAKRTLLSDLVGIVGDPQRIEAILKVLQHDEIVRSAEVGNHSSAWQLDHDYLARSVLAEARQADRWAVSLRESKVRYQEAAYDWRQRWAALLPVGVLARVCWERARRRLEFGEAASYVRLSAVRPAIALLCMVLIGASAHAWYQDRALTLEANRLIDKFAAQGEKSAVLQIWRAPPILRRRVYELVTKEAGQLERATNSAWPLAHAGFDVTEVREITQILRTSLEQSPTEDRASRLVKIYEVVAARLTDATDIKVEASALRRALEQAPTNWRVSWLVGAYTAVAARLSDAMEIKEAVMTLRTALERAPADERDILVEKCYAVVAARLTDADVKVEATALRRVLEQAPTDERASWVMDAYALVAARLTDATDIKDSAMALRSALEQAPIDERARKLVDAYTTVVARLTDADVKIEATALRKALEQEQADWRADRLVGAYTAVAARLADADVKIEATALRKALEQEQADWRAGRLVGAYIAVAPRLADADVKVEATALHRALKQATAQEHAKHLANAYAVVAERLTDATEIKNAAMILRSMSLEQAPTDERAGRLIEAYGVVAARLTDAGEIKDAVIALRKALDQAPTEERGQRLVEAYKIVAAQLTDADVKIEATALRRAMEQAKTDERAGWLAVDYARVVTRLTNASEIKDAAVTLRRVLEQEPAREDADYFAYAYEVVAARLTDADIKAEVVTLRRSMEQAPTGTRARLLVMVYGVVAARLTDATEVKYAATALRTALERTTGWSRMWLNDRLVDAYTDVAARLTDADVKVEAMALRTSLVQAPKGELARLLLDAYTAVAARLIDADVKVEAMALRTSLEQAEDGVYDLAKAYAALAGVMAKRADPDRHFALVQETLLIAGHPFLDDYAPLLSVLKPLAGTDFDGNLSAALSWAEQNYGIRPDQLRPPLLEH